MAIGSLGTPVPVLKASNKIAVFGRANPLMELLPPFDANGVSFSNHSDNHVRIRVVIKNDDVVIMLPPNSTESYHFAKAVIGSINMIVVDKPNKNNGGIISVEEMAVSTEALDGYVDINLIREQ